MFGIRSDKEKKLIRSQIKNIKDEAFEEDSDDDLDYDYFIFN